MYDRIEKAYLEVVTQGSRSTYFAISKLTYKEFQLYSGPSKGSRSHI